MFYLVLIGTFVLGLGLLWNEPKWSLFAIFAALLLAMPIGMIAMLGGFSEQSLVSLFDLVSFGVLPLVFVLVAPFVTLFRGMRLRAKRRRDEEELAAELARFREGG